MAASKIKALQMWCRKMTEGYRDVDVRDFTVSWRDGLAFCAIIHHFRPDLIDYDSLSKENVFDNNHLAFTVGERELDIPAFLDAEDMVRLKTPDKLSIITYVSQYYNKLSQLPQLGGPGVKGKITSTAGIKRHQASTPSSEPESKKVTPAKDASSTDVSRPKIRTLGDKCAICSNKVYLLERHIEDGKLYHRSCFRHSDLSPTNKVYTRSPFLSPSLHGADNSDIRGTETSLSHKPTDLSKTFTVDEKTVAVNQANRMIEPSSLFSNRDKTSKKNSAGDNSLKEDGNKNKGEKFGVPLTNTKIKVSSQDQKISSSATSLATESVENNNKPSSTSLTAMSCEKPSSDTWFGDKDFKKTETKRSLPLIFHQDHNVDDKNSDKSKSAVFTVSKSTMNQNASHNEIKTPVLPENKSTQNAIHDKTSPKFFLSGKSVLPVPKPRQNKNVLDERKEESMDTSEINFSPKPSPRFKHATTTTIHEVATSQQNAPTSEKKEQLQLKFIPEASNSESSSILSSPQPLSASAPPSLPASAPPPLPASAPPPLPATSPLTPLHSPHDLSAPAKESFPVPMPSEVSSTDHLTIIPTSGSLVLNSGSSSLYSSRYSPSSTENISSSSFTSTITLTLPSVTKPASAMSAVLFTAHREEQADLKVSVSQDSAQQTVVHLVKPPNTDKQEQEMRSGLLKSLAAVRKTPVVTEVHGASSNTVHVPAPNKTLNVPDQSPAVPKKSFISNKLDKFQSRDVQHKTKSESELSYTTNRSNLDNSKNLASLGVAGKSKDVEAKGFNMSHGKTREHNPPGPVAPGVKGSTELETKPFGTTYIRERAKSTPGILPLSSSLQPLPKNITQEEPSCLQEKLANTKTNGDKTERPKSTGNTLNTNGDAIKLDWQKEAERRMAALRGNFVDPEVKKLPIDSDRYVQRETKLSDVKKVPSESKREVSTRVPMSLKPVETARTVPMMPAEKSTSDALVSHHSKFERSSKDEKQSKNEEKKNLSSSDKVDTLHRGEPLILPPSKPERSWAIKDRMSQPDHKHMLNIAQMNKGGNAHETKEQKSGVEDTRKKIAVETPQPLLPPPRQQKKKILVDEPFEFPVSPVQKALPENFKHTPPPRPPPPKKTELSPANLSAIELQQQLREIDKKLNQLELQGRHLEDSIRSVETAEDEDELMMEWFKLITNKNDLVRQENDLVYMSRELDLEDEQDQIENQLRYLLNKEAHEKSMEEKTEEEYLIQRKIDIVNKRNDIVDSMDEDRLRYEEEDRDIAKILESKDFSKISEGQLALAKPEKQLAKSTFYT